MNCAIALILSPTNKAKAISDGGGLVIVEKHWSPDRWHYEAWKLKKDHIYSYTTTSMAELDHQLLVWGAGLDEDYWQSL